jgi:hypothetical protein
MESANRLLSQQGLSTDVKPAASTIPLSFDLGLNWAQRTSGSSVESISVDSSGNSYVASSIASGNGFNVNLAKVDASGNTLWNKTFNTNAASSTFKVATVDSDVLLLGDFRGSVAFSSNYSLNNTSSTLDDIFITILDGNGNVEGARQYGSANESDTAIDLAVDSTGIYIAGNFKGTFDVDPGTAVKNLSSTNNSAFVVKWDFGGNHIWSQQVSLNNGTVRGWDLALNGTYTYLVGDFTGSGTLVNGINVTSQGGTDGFAARFFNTNGQSDGGFGVGGTANDSVRAAAPGLPNIFYFTGTFEGSLTQGNTTLQSSGGTDAFVAKADFTANPTPWLQRIGTAGNDTVNAIVNTGSALYVGGALGDTAYVTKLDLAGNLTSNAQFNGTGSDTVKSLTFAQNNLYVGGTAGLDADLDPSYSGTKVINAGGTGFAARFNPVKSEVVFWRNQQTGQVSTWTVQDGALGSFSTLSVVPSLDWQIEEIADFDEDGDKDILWRNRTTGENSFWRMNGTEYVESVNLQSVGNLNWEIEAVGDLVGTGSKDILWRNKSTGEVSVWELNKMALTDYKLMSNVNPSLDWEIQGVGNFKAGGKQEVLWRNRTSGAVVYWEVQGLDAATQRYGIASNNLVTVTDQNWQVNNFYDANNDGIDEIGWYNSATQQNSVWQVNGATVSYYTVPQQTSGQWALEDVVDLNGDNTKDFLWRNLQTGAVESWLNTAWSFNNPTTTTTKKQTLAVVGDLNWEIA